jgi:hypothetical protein
MIMDNKLERTCDEKVLIGIFLEELKNQEIPKDN